ncbi:MAG: two-component sensor histidine kinase [Lysobacterales bacterium]|jgi:two-component system sensor histidine kinase PhoQ|nr:MAG: two-component sensor histidine kinase [Xanthomonadales bacterium]
MAAATWSLRRRLLYSAAAALLVFLGATGLAIDLAFVASQRAALEQRLQGYVYAFLAKLEVSRGGAILVPEPLPEPRLERPSSGLYAALIAPGFRWRSPSALGRELPVEDVLEPGERHFQGPIAFAGSKYYRLSQGLVFEDGSGRELALTLHVVEDELSLLEQISVFRERLVIFLGALACILLILLFLAMRWSMAPFVRVTREIAEIEQGQRERLGGGYPSELEPLTRNLNALIEAERENLARYRHTLADLAHSLKTPLAVLRSAAENESGEALRAQVLAQVERMDGIVAYQLARAARSGHRTLSAPVPITPSAESLVRSLEKVYADKKILCEFEIEEAARFHGEEGDLLELLGNLLENAFKWAKSRVLLSASARPSPGARRPALVIDVEDDGPGIPEEQIDRVLQRGVRGDERVPGHGIGLAIVQDIVRSYRGELRIGRSSALGGARFTVELSAPG